MLAGKRVRFWLSVAGRAELPEPLNTGNATDNSVEALVVDEGRLGVWVSVETEDMQLWHGLPAVMLLKWEHFCTALTTYETRQSAERPQPGFRP
ncbi:MAG TPA: hypothetical protein VEG30_02855 [Terriglobales bacterium]|nr:hypothetical protein [Terriglobales bacterium]